MENKNLQRLLQAKLNNWRVVQSFLQDEPILTKQDLTHDQYKLAKTLVGDGTLIDIGRGVLVDATWPWEENSLLLRQIVLKQGIYYGETALSIWKLTETLPYEIYMSFRLGYALPKKPEQWVQNVHAKQVSPTQLVTGVSELAVTGTKRTIKVYSPEKTLIDLVRNPTEFDEETVTRAFRLYLKSKERRLTKLSILAKQQGALGKIQQRLRGLDL